MAFGEFISLLFELGQCFYFVVLEVLLAAKSSWMSFTQNNTSGKCFLEVFTNQELPDTSPLPHLFHLVWLMQPFNIFLMRVVERNVNRKRLMICPQGAFSPLCGCWSSGGKEEKGGRYLNKNHTTSWFVLYLVMPKV